MSDLSDIYTNKPNQFGIDYSIEITAVYDPTKKEERIEENSAEIYALLKQMYSFGEPVRVDAHRAKAKEVFRKACAMISKIENGAK